MTSSGRSMSCCYCPAGRGPGGGVNRGCLIFSSWKAQNPLTALRGVAQREFGKLFNLPINISTTGSAAWVWNGASP